MGQQFHLLSRREKFGTRKKPRKGHNAIEVKHMSQMVNVPQRFPTTSLSSGHEVLLSAPQVLLCTNPILSFKGEVCNPWLTTPWAFWLHLFYFDICRQASWEMPHTGNLPSTCAVTAGTHVVVNDPSDWRDRFTFISGYYALLLHSECKIQWNITASY